MGYHGQDQGRIIRNHKKSTHQTEGFTLNEATKEAHIIISNKMKNYV